MRDGHFEASCGPELRRAGGYFVNCIRPEVDVWSGHHVRLLWIVAIYDESIPNLFKKIKGGIYVAKLCQSWSERLDQSDVVSRSIETNHDGEIRNHPWYVIYRDI